MAKDKGKGIHAAHGEAKTTTQEEESVTDSHVDREEIRRMQEQIRML